MTLPEEQVSQIDSIAAQEEISLYERFTEAEAAAILDISVQTVRRIRERGEIAYIRISERNVRFFGVHLCQYLLSKVKEAQCPDTTKTDTKSETTGFPNRPAVQHGVERGTKTDKPDASRLARSIFKKQS